MDEITHMKKEKPFSPLLAPNNEIDIKELSYPLLGSYKLDGCRLVAKDGQFFTRSLKPLPNKQLNEKFNSIRQYSEANNVMLDGELYTHRIPFQFIVSCFMTHDYEAKLAIKKWDELCEKHDYHISREDVIDNMKFYMFDGVNGEHYEQPFGLRYINNVNKWSKDIPDLIEEVKHVVLNNAEEVETYFQEALNAGYEGLILRNPEGIYKFNRCSMKQNIIFKYKPFVTRDSIIKGIVQATKVNEDVEKTTNELGRSVTSKKAEDRHLVEKAQSFVVDFNGQDLKVPIAMTDKEKEYIWNHQDEYIGKWIEFKFMEIGMKKGGLPRIPKFVRMREDKD